MLKWQSRSLQTAPGSMFEEREPQVFSHVFYCEHNSWYLVLRTTINAEHLKQFQVTPSRTVRIRLLRPVPPLHFHVLK